MSLVEFSIDRPFGFYLFDVVRSVVLSVADYDISTFAFNTDLPLSTLSPVLTTIAAYYVIIFGGREVMKNFSPLRLDILFKIHNFTLSASSLLMFLLLVEQLIPILYRHGILYAICNEGSWTQEIVFVYYLNYIFKYVEFIDTFFLFLRKKPLTFLHTYHHGATALLCYTQLIGHTSVSWVPIVLNLFVHVVMYWYYFLAACKIRVWWKEWVTRIQIIQFVIDLGFVYFAAYTYFAWTYFPHMPNMGSCAGEEFAAIYGCGLLTSYLFLFIAFYIKVYYTNGKKASKSAKKVASESSSSAKTSGSSVGGSTVKSRKL